MNSNSILIKVMSGLVLCFLLYYGVLFMLQRQFLFPGTQIVPPLEGAELVPGVESIWVDTSSGQIETWFLPPLFSDQVQPSPVVMFAHGNAELIDFWPEELQPLQHMGIGVLLVEYPGYGRSDGAPTQTSITEGFVAAYDMLLTRPDVDAARIIGMGRSLGGGAVCALAAERPLAALILMSAFTNVQAFAAQFLAPGFLVQDEFNNLAVVRTYSGPVLVIHGKHDTLIPYHHGVALAEAAQNGELITYACGHNDCPPDWDVFWHDIERFLQQVR